MAICTKCNITVEDNVKFCPACGSPIEEQPQETAAPAPEKNDFSSKVAALNDTADTTAEFEASDIEQNKIFAVLGYLSWLVLVPIFAAPKSKFARFHANQGLVLAITEVAWWIVTAILGIILSAISWRLGFISTILGLVNIVFVILAILGIVNAANGKAKELPIVGKFKILK